MSEVQGNDEQGKPEKHLVILVHGINTLADWMPAMTETLESAGFLVAPTSFGGMSVSRFLLPFQRPRQQAIQRVLTNIRTAKEQCQPHKISVITHSFGTYVVARILQKEAWPWHRIIFCGSVVREDFPLDEVRDRFTAPLLNEVGTRGHLAGNGGMGDLGVWIGRIIWVQQSDRSNQMARGFSAQRFFDAGFLQKILGPIPSGWHYHQRLGQAKSFALDYTGNNENTAARDCAAFILGASRTWCLVHSLWEGNYD
jgi:hypothetical protein